MIKVMIVDDEEIVRLGLHALADWESHGFSLCYDAANGLAALDMLKENGDIQIVLVDLQMPKMDGMQFLEEINRAGLRQERDVEVIVLSAHDRYDLVRQAFRLGVSDYILKFEMNKDEVLKHLQSAARRLVRPSFEINDNAHFEDRLLAAAFMGGDTTGLLDTGQYAHYAAAAVLPDNLTSFADKLPLVRSIARGQMGPYVNIASLSQSEMGMLFAFKNKSIKASENELEAVLRKFHSHLNNYVNLQVTIGVGDVFSDISQVGQQYAISRQNADMRFVIGRGRTIFPRDSMGVASYDIGSMAGLLRKLIDALQSRCKEAITAALEVVLDTIKQYNPKEIEKIFPYYFELLFSVMLHLDEVGVTTVDVFHRNINFYEEIRLFKTRDEINGWMRDIVNLVADYLEGRSGSASRPVNMAKNFVMCNFFDKELSLRMVSTYVGISENHLSSIFKKQTGQTFTKYVTELRIERAKTLLKETNLKIYEIAENVGFDNAEYFSKTFKKVTGKSPNQFVIRSP